MAPGVFPQYKMYRFGTKMCFVNTPEKHAGVLTVPHLFLHLHIEDQLAFDILGAHLELVLELVQHA